MRGPTGCRYLADQRQTSYVRDGWNLTGDAFVQDAQGRFHFAARTDDMIISAGYNIAGPEVEGALLGLDPASARRLAAPIAASIAARIAAPTSRKSPSAAPPRATKTPASESSTAPTCALAFG